MMRAVFNALIFVLSATISACGAACSCIADNCFVLVVSRADGRRRAVILLIFCGTVAALVLLDSPLSFLNETRPLVKRVASRARTGETRLPASSSTNSRHGLREPSSKVSNSLVGIAGDPAAISQVARKSTSASREVRRHGPEHDVRQLRDEMQEEVFQNNHDTGALDRVERVSGHCSKNRTLLLLYAGTGMVSFPVRGEREFLQYCPDLCVVWEKTDSMKYDETADVVQSGSHYSHGRSKRKKQLSMFFTMESPMHSGLGSAGVMNSFNLKRSYHLDSDVFAAYIPIGEKHLKEVVAPPPMKFGDKLKNAMAAIVSNCGAPSGRSGLLRELIAGMDVHSFGSCLHNKALPRDQASKGGSLKIVRTYKLYFAVENSLCKDYVTEKLWRTLYHGAIPVVTSYSNTPNYTKFTPNAQAYINLEQFASTPDLIAYLKRVTGDEQLYRKHLRHRYTPSAPGAVTEEYRQTWGVLADRRRWCKLARRMLVSPGVAELKERTLHPDSSCAPTGRVRSSRGTKEHKLSGKT
ncbi:alpha-(1,3)-fucosyltransferase 11-like [Sycon ciliatum]|uniref:alpha-(1,3)-fucosyltransferase 11-like n=1 Tax=Sycon ciliatum TaxID=27933 RepID=UPI0020ACCC65|eukprot:scpid48921/ scgid5933/ Alpha-(1,3)-fucosyltransferase 11; Fucosyltransferase XI; Galactoside 3-L-fucosyltransferase 11